MKQRRFLKMVSLLTLTAFFGVTVSGCTMANTNWGFLSFWSKDKAMDETDVNRFVGKLRVRPGNPDSHYLLGTYYQERAKHREALSEFAKTLFIEPAHVKALNASGISYDRLGEHAKAAECYQQALTLDPKLDYVLNNLGYSYVLSRDYSRAVDAFEKAAALNANDTRIRNNLAMAYAMAGEYEKSLTHFEAAGNGDKGAAHVKLAAIYYEKAMFSKAAEQYRLALSLNPSSDSAKRGLDASRELQKIAEAVKHVKDEQIASTVSAGAPVLAENPAASPVEDAKAARHVETARELFEKKAFKEARREYTEALALNPALETARKGVLASESLARIEELPVKSDSGFKASSAEVRKVLASKPSPVGIEIANGNGKRYMARDIGNYLKNQGFHVVHLTNANHFNHAEGSIQYDKAYRELALEIAGRLPQIRDMRELKAPDRAAVKVKVLIGKDLIGHRQDFMQN